MEHHYEILSKLIKRKRPEVPQEFFGEFYASIEPDILPEADLGKTDKPDVPENFFTNFHANLKAEIEAEALISLDGFEKSQKPKVPVDYFDNFSDDILVEVKRQNRRGRVIKISFWSTIAAAAAVLLLIINLNPEPERIEQPVANETEVSTEMDENYVAYFNEYDLIDHILENDIQVEGEETDEVVYDYVEGEIEDVYLDL